MVDRRVRVNLRRRSEAGHERRARGGAAVALTGGASGSCARAQGRPGAHPDRPDRRPPRVLWRLESEAGAPAALVMWQRTCWFLGKSLGTRVGAVLTRAFVFQPRLRGVRVLALGLRLSAWTRLDRRGSAAQLDSCALPPYCCTSTVPRGRPRPTGASFKRFKLVLASLNYTPRTPLPVRTPTAHSRTRFVCASQRAQLMSLSQLTIRVQRPNTPSPVSGAWLSSSRARRR